MLLLLFACFSSSRYDFEPGLRYERYLNEVAFCDVAESRIVETGDLTSFRFGYNSLSLIGSFCPLVTGKYVFRVRGKPYSQIVFNHDQSGIGPAASCWPALSSSDQLGPYDLDANHCYPIRANLRTGCALYPQYLNFMVSRDGEEFYVPNTDELLSSQFDDCRDGYYGEKCDKKCNVSCNNGFCFNGTKGDGTCICQDFFKRPNCEPDDPIIPPNASIGSHMVVYKNEVSFTDVNAEMDLPGVGVDSFEWVLNSAILTGSILPEFDGDYQLKLHAKPISQLLFMGGRYPNEIGGAATCSEDIYSEFYSDVFHLHRHTTYPYQINFRSGCGLLHWRFIHLYWKNGPKWGSVDKAPWEEIPLNLSYNTIANDCVPEMYGPECNNTCQTCPSNMICNASFGGDGSCVCPPQSTDCFCSKDSDCSGNGSCDKGICKCKPSYYGEHCETFCDAATTCSGHGKCGDNGHCKCDAPYRGSTCAEKCTREKTCNNHGTCNEEGDCVCDQGFKGNTCAVHPYMPTINETQKGAETVLFNDEFFSSGWAEAPWILETTSRDFNHVSYRSGFMTGSIVVENYTRAKLKVYARPFAQLSFHFNVVPAELGPAASCLAAMYTEFETNWVELYPNKLYPFSVSYRSGCALYWQHLQLEWKLSDIDGWSIIPHDNLRVVKPEQQCLERYFGVICDQYCDADCNMAGECYLDGKQSKCKCLPGYFGEHCEIYCNPDLNCSGHGKCGLDGKCECDIYYSGEHCDETCTREKTCNNHGSCTDEGKCQCDENYEGNTCAQHTYQPSANESLRGANYTLYTTELFSGNPIDGPKIVPTLDMKFDRLMFNSAITRGSIVAKDHVRGQIRINAKPYGQVIFMNKSYPTEIGPALSCNTDVTLVESEEVELIPNKFYDFEVKYRSGCSFIEQRLALEWRFGDTDEWIPIPEENLRVSLTNQSCLDRYFGEQCNQYCDADCNLHGDCYLDNGVSKCKCFEPYHGDHCELNGTSASRRSTRKESPKIKLSYVLWTVGGICAICLIALTISGLKRRREERIKQELQVTSTPLINVPE